MWDCSLGRNFAAPKIIGSALELLKNNPTSNLIIDARNGFEDEKADVQWGFTVLLPAMAKTDCKAVVFILSQLPDIEEEMNMWAQEFGKYFIVKNANSLESAFAPTIQSN